MNQQTPAQRIAVLLSELRDELEAYVPDENVQAWDKKDMLKATHLLRERFGLCLGNSIFLTERPATIPQDWIKQYVDKLQSAASEFPDTYMRMIGKVREGTIEDMLQAYRESTR